MIKSTFFETEQKAREHGYIRPAEANKILFEKSSRLGIWKDAIIDYEHHSFEYKKADVVHIGKFTSLKLFKKDDVEKIANIHKKATAMELKFI